MDESAYAGAARTLNRWRVADIDHWVEGKDPPHKLDKGLLAIDFVGWVPEDWIVVMGRSFSTGHTFDAPPTTVSRGGSGNEADQRYSSQQWVREQLGNLVMQGVIGEEERDRAVQKQERALKLPFKGYHPNAPKNEGVRKAKKGGCMSGGGTRP